MWGCVEGLGSGGLLRVSGGGWVGGCRWFRFQGEGDEGRMCHVWTV